MPKRDLKAACIKEALKIIEKKGVENLSLRQVARRLKVSHQAPYKHFPSKDHLLAEIIKSGFETFGSYLSSAEKTGDPMLNMRRLGEAYLQFATDYPLYYHLMFSSPHPDGKKHPEMADAGSATFDILRGRIQDLKEHTGSDMNVDAESMFIWSTMHGLSSILAWQHMEKLLGDPDTRGQIIQHVMGRADDALKVAATPPKSLRKGVNG